MRCYNAQLEKKGTTLEKLERWKLRHASLPSADFQN